MYPQTLICVTSRSEGNNCCIQLLNVNEILYDRKISKFDEL